MDRQILFATGECVLGRVLVARSERGVCAILLGDDAKALERDLRARFTNDDLRESTTELALLLTNVKNFLEAPRTGLDTPLDLRGSELEQRVWNALREIPPGATRTYSEIAQRLGVAATAKEVGEACAANPLAVAVPCHRVLRKDGSLGGYRWGLRRKRALLERERAA
ncbi:MAG TPA: methylated-DNA--[protein]-cysteine S-methyltransferase [Burkholderiales bacterium]|nr:methylated-DNA--[protein]-cysteine S-methyltransferase [Burkholderiales bacterium]